MQTTNGGCRCMRFVPRQNARLITGGVNSIRLWRLKVSHAAYISQLFRVYVLDRVKRDRTMSC